MQALEVRSCPLCGEHAGKAVKYPATFRSDDLNATIFSARRTPDRVHFQLVSCVDCGIVFSDPACDASTLDALYTQSHVHYDRQVEQIYESYAPVLDRALPWLSHRGTFVELGGGTGFMLRYGAATGFASQIEVEPSADAERKFEPCTPNARFIRSIFVPGVLPRASASLVCFFQMLDHVPDPRSFLETVFDVLEPGGVAVCVTHNTRALSARVLGERSPIFDIEHTFLFAPENLSKLFQSTGFGRVEAFPIANPYALRYWLQLAPVPSAIRRVAQRALETAKLADVRIPLRAGNFAVIGQKSHA